MTTNKAYVRRLALKDWSLSTSSGIASLTVQRLASVVGCAVLMAVVVGGSMRLPQKLGMATMSNGLFPVWLYRGHLWVTCHAAIPMIFKRRALRPNLATTQRAVVVGVFRPEIHG